MPVLVTREALESPDGVRVRFTAPEPFETGTAGAMVNGLTNVVTEVSDTQVDLASAPLAGDTVHLYYVRP